MLPVSRQFPNHSQIFLKITSSQMIILSWSQGNWGLCIKPGRSTGTASHIALAMVARSEGLLCPATLGTYSLIIITITIISSSVGSRSQAGRAEKPFRYSHIGLCHGTGSPCRVAWFYTQAPIPLGPR